MAFKLKKAINQYKNPYWKAKCDYIRYYDQLPIDDKIIFLESQHGKEFNGNIFSIAQYLSASPKYRDYKIYLSCSFGCLDKFEEKLKQYSIENVKLTVLSSDEYVRVMASAKYLINDNTFMPFYQKKEGQVYLNTWHGTPLKSLGRKIKNDAVNIGNAQKNFVICDWLLFPNNYTKDHMIEDYMIHNISNSKIVMGGYPRNDVFFDIERRKALRASLGLDDKKVYTYMPTFRGTAKTGMSNKSDAYLLYNLYELDKIMAEDEILFLNLHPVAKSLVNFEDFTHIRPFPAELDTYDFLNIADCLVSDYSSVFFDFACTGKKIILFTFDKEDYLRDRGVYISLDELPYPQAKDYAELLKEMRRPKEYDDSEFVSTFCPWDNANSTAQLCDMIILGEDTGLGVEEMPNNGKENVLIYGANLAPNGITAALRNLLSTVDLEKRNYYISFPQTAAAPHGENLFTFPEGVNYYATVGGLNLTVRDRFFRGMFKKKLIGVRLYMALCGKRVRQDFLRDFGCANFDTMIQFSGYGPDVILRLAQFEGKKIIYVHSDMLEEIKSRGNQRRDVLRYAYRKYDKIANVTEDIVKTTKKIAGSNKNLVIAKNAIPHKDIYEKSLLEAGLDPDTISSVDQDTAMEFLRDETTKKFITVGRFSPEKGHERLVNAFAAFAKDHDDARLVIMGGSSFKGHYDILLKHVEKLGLTDKVLLLQKVSNPYAVLRLCDYFILSSFYEGFGLVLVEADIVGKPVVSTDITGPRGFMKKNDGVLVENSQKGIEDALDMLYNGKVEKLTVDYDAYNREVVEEFEAMM